MSVGYLLDLQLPCQHRKERLLGMFGPDIALPEALRKLADCVKACDMTDICQARYTSLPWASERP
jgi:hypothetical protein